MNQLIINGLIKSFQTHKALIDHTLAQLDTEALHWKNLPKDNSIAILVKHISGHLSSRFAEFWESDGERADRNRQQEMQDTPLDKKDLLLIWEKAWDTVFANLGALSDDDLYKSKLLRGVSLPIADYIPRVLTHFSYHGGQIVWIAKQLLGDKWVGFGG